MRSLDGVTTAPRDTVDAAVNHGDVPARYPLVCTRAGCERYVDLRRAGITGTGPPLAPHPGAAS